MRGRFGLRRALAPLAAAVSAAVLLGGCGDDATAPAPALPACSPESTVAADFSLPDVNPSSTTYDSLVAPRQFLGMVSAWYFGHAT